MKLTDALLNFLKNGKKLQLSKCQNSIYNYIDNVMKYSLILLWKYKTNITIFNPLCFIYTVTLAFDNLQEVLVIG